MMQKPDTTYRLQLSPQFTFDHLQEILDYLEKIGVTTVYSAPFFQAREGSTHGYDVTDPFTISRQIGKLEDFQKIGEQLKQKGMTWLQDIVPNHMAFDSSNVWLKDVFELGPASKYYNYFDINWEYKGLNKVMAPFLGGPLEEILEKKELKILFNEDGFSLGYYDNIYPLNVKSYAEILKRTGLQEAGEDFSNFSGGQEQWQELKVSFLRKVEAEGARDKISQTLEKINNERESLEEIIDLQYYLPAYWKATEREINYRRFFTINDLICLGMEDQQVFDAYHHFIKQLCDAGLIQGLRIDHIDGLFDPRGYLEKLRNLLGDDFYIIVEKILEAEEALPLNWPVQGTSGYEFLARANHLFTKTRSGEKFTEAYRQISPRVADYEALVYNKKLFILKERMGGELHNLWELMKNKELLGQEEHRQEKEWKEALSAFLAGFPVYRIYPKDFPLKEDEKEIINIAFETAIEKLPEQQGKIKELKKLFCGEANGEKEDLLYFLQRCQQFSGPLAAKGVEDTSFYIYNRLVSHNEVGDSPEHFGISGAEYHEKMLQRMENFPLSVNATATHDTKRGEDSRMRLSVVSELPQEWFSKVEEWKALNDKIRKSSEAPGDNEEYFIYQTLLAGLPFSEEENFVSRTCDYLQKVLREAKVHSNWAEPDMKYEEAVFEFIKDILGNKEFRESFDPFQQKIAAYGAIKSLAQVLLKITSPGIPDIYQGTELWDLSYVDPDNRRPVDYDLRKKYLKEFESLEDTNLNDAVSGLKKDFGSGKVKMYTTVKALRTRREHIDLFQKGEYIPLSIKGEAKGSFIAYARQHEKTSCIIIIPALVTDCYDEQDLLFKAGHANDTIVELPDDLPGRWKNIFTGEIVEGEESLPIGKLLANFPVGFLINKD